MNLCVDVLLVIFHIVGFARDDESHSVFIPLFLNNLLVQDVSEVHILLI